MAEDNAVIKPVKRNRLDFIHSPPLCCASPAICSAVLAVAESLVKAAKIIIPLPNNIGNAMFFGPGAGGPATASAVLGDVVDIVRNPGRKQPVDWSAEPADLTDPDAFEASFFLRTKLDKAACEQALGEIRWLPDQTGFHGGFTGKTCKKAIAAAGLALDAVWPVLE